jgi:glycosyltransferase involved in cell wall biosynthesis
MLKNKTKILLFANTDWYLYNFRLSLAEKLRYLSYEVVLVSPSGDYTNQFEQAGFRWVSLDMNRRSVNPISEILVIKKLIGIYLHEKPDLVHHFTIKSVIYGSLAAKFAGISNIVNAVAGLGFVFTNKSILASVLRPLVKQVLKFSLNGNKSRLILQNPDDQALFLDAELVSNEKTRLIKGSGVNTGRFIPHLKDNNGDVNILLASRLLWDKGIADYVEAARIVKTTHKNVNFLLAGKPDEGNPDSVQGSDLVNWKKEGIIEALGHVENMAERLEDINIVVLPTVYGEGVPRILIEAAAAGIPLVATDVPGCREIVVNDQNGYLVPARDPQSLAEALAILLSDTGLCESMGKAGRKLVLEEFDEKSVLSRTIDVYEEILS